MPSRSPSPRWASSRTTSCSAPGRDAALNPTGEASESAESIRSAIESAERWYHVLELAPGVHTPGAGHHNIAITRELLARIDVEGHGEAEPLRCLDIGTREALIPILLERRGAGAVVAYDRQLWRSNLDLVARALGARFELVGGVGIKDLRERLRGASHRPPYDLVVLSGVLYHMFDPMMGLAVARGLVRNGGVLLVETMATFNDETAMHFGSAGRMGPNTFWVPSIPCLDYLIRFFRLEALDVAHLGPWQKEGCPPHGRIAVACRAVPDPPAEPGDPRIGGTQYQDDLSFEEYLDWDEVRSDLPEVRFEPGDRRMVRRASGSIELLATTGANPPHEVSEQQIRLDLEAVR